MKNSGIPLSALPQRLRDQVIAQLATKNLRKQFPGKAALRQKTGPKLNKTEAAFGEHVRALFPSSVVHEQAVTLLLANGVRYTPDVFLPGRGAVRPAFYEVKGFMREDAGVKLKVAASVHRWADFFLVRREGKCGGWDIQVILP